MNRRRSNAQRKCWNFLGIFFVSLTRKVPEALAIDGPNDYNGSEFFWSPSLDVYHADPHLHPVLGTHEFYNDHARSMVYQDPSAEDRARKPVREKMEYSRALSESFEGGPNGMDGVPPKNSFQYGLGQRSMESDDESLANSGHKKTDFSDNELARDPSLWKMTSGLRKSENASVDTTVEPVVDSEEDRQVRKQCVAKILELENFLNICKVAKAMHGIVREVKRHGVLMKLVSSFNINRNSFRRFSYNSVFNRLTRDLKLSNNKMKKAVDLKKKSAGKRPKIPKKKPPKKKPTTPKLASESEEDTAEDTA